MTNSTKELKRKFATIAGLCIPEPRESPEMAKIRKELLLDETMQADHLLDDIGPLLTTVSSLKSQASTEFTESMTMKRNIDNLEREASAFYGAAGKFD